MPVIGQTEGEEEQRRRGLADEVQRFGECVGEGRRWK
jgi:hypothetical protein